MKRVRELLLVSAVAVPAILLAEAPGAASAEEGAAGGSCVTASCHPKILAETTVHAAAESCDSCHESAAAPHPQKGKKTFRLTEEPPKLCFACHEETGGKASLHPPVKDGECLSCHEPHSTAQPKLLRSAVKDLCSGCHAGPTEKKLLHGPVGAGECLACHVPHQSDEKPLLAKAPGAICFDCHQTFPRLLEKKNVHPALESGCTSCHDPHGSDFPKLLADSGAAVCATCHSEIAEAAAGAKVPHAPVRSEKGCVSCHDPHAADGEKLLAASAKESCLGCHAKLIAKTSTNLHGPIREGKCGACHEVHGGGRRKLLVDDFPEDAYVPYTGTSFALCFTCHDRDLLRFPDTSFATGFRDGERNLHFLHVNDPKKGRSCRLCHDVHGARNEKLIADSVPFGTWKLPIQFVKTETGGSCSPGCHKPYSYDRKTPGKKPETPAKGGGKKG